MKFTKEEKFLAKMVIVVLIGLLIRGYGLHVQQKTIESASLVSVNENTHQSYVLSFDGDEHLYTGSWKEMYTK